MAGTPKRRSRKVDELEQAALAVAATVAKLIPAHYVKSADGRDLVPDDFDSDDIGWWWNQLLLYTQCAAEAAEIVAEDCRLKAGMPSPSTAPKTQYLGPLESRDTEEDERRAIPQFSTPCSAGTTTLARAHARGS